MEAFVELRGRPSGRGSSRDRTCRVSTRPARRTASTCSPRFAISPRPAPPLCVLLRPILSRLCFSAPASVRGPQHLPLRSKRSFRISSVPPPSPIRPPWIPPSPLILLSSSPSHNVRASPLEPQASSRPPTEGGTVHRTPDEAQHAETALRHFLTAQPQRQRIRSSDAPPPNRAGSARSRRGSYRARRPSCAMWCRRSSSLRWVGRTMYGFMIPVRGSGRS